MSLSTSDRRALTFLIVFGVGMGAYLLLIEPLALRYKTALEGVEAAQDTIQKTSKDRKFAELRKQKYTERKQELNQLLSMYGGRTPPSQRLSVALSDVQRAAEQSGVKLGEVRPLDAKSVDEKGLFDEQLFQLEFSGSYGQSASMLYLLETGRGLMRILQCDLNTKENSEVMARVLARRSFLHEPELDPSRGVQVAPASLLRAGVERRPGLGGLFIAERNGYLADQQAGISLIQTDQALDYFRRGDLEAIVVSQVEFLLLAAEGHPVTVVAALSKGSSGAGLVMRTKVGKDNLEIKGIKDLAGRVIAVQENSSTHLMLAGLLTNASMKLGDVRIQDRTPQQAAEALIAGELDAALLGPPYLSRVTESGKFRVAPVPDGPWSQRYELLIVRNEALRQKPTAIRHLVEAAINGNAWWQEHPTQGNGMVAQSLWASSEETAVFRKSIELLGPAENAVLLNAATGTLSKDLELARKFLQEDAGIDVPQDLLKSFTDAYLKPTATVVPKKEEPKP